MREKLVHTSSRAEKGKKKKEKNKVSEQNTFRGFFR